MPALRGAVARRYAEAAFALALDRGTTEAWERDIGQAVMLLDDPDSRALFQSRAISLQDKRKALEAMLTGVDPLVRNLLLLLIVRGRLGLLKQIAEEYRRLLHEHLGVVEAEVTTALSLDDRSIQQLKARLAQQVGRRVEIRLFVDPVLVGGAVIRIGDRLVDGSVAQRLQALRRRLTAPV
ncbi:MAG: F0F1 ATP synthase subunit delta [Chloroflexi bacterium]|nr:F0F1 ATP synthase subunit delta [Chloroflexota bacterium]